MATLTQTDVTIGGRQVALVGSTVTYPRKRFNLSASNYTNADGVQLAVAVQIIPYRVLTDGSIEDAPEAYRKSVALDSALASMAAEDQAVLASLAQVVARIDRSHQG